MFVKVVKRAPRFVISLLFAVILTLLAFGVALASFLGVTLALQGWATHPLTTIHAPAQR
jgi:heme/copper-type cytochrome/quinol oxidase subunit 4